VPSVRRLEIICMQIANKINRSASKITTQNKTKILNKITVFETEVPNIRTLNERVGCWGPCSRRILLYIFFKIIGCQAPYIGYDIVNNGFRSSRTPCIFVNFFFPKNVLVILRSLNDANSLKVCHKNRTGDFWNIRREIQIQTKLDQQSWKNGQHQTSETRSQLQT